ncbi:MAG: hypothetical protein QXK76_03235 [Candidatus Woesearchaeota archaeon]
MLDAKTIKKISEFVYIKPRTIQEIAFHIQKNWRTADAYVEKIAKEQGIIAVRTFREGTRGALKIAYWNNIEKIHSSEFQERLFKKIETARDKNDFSPFDIYQYVPENKRNAFLEEQTEEKITEKQDLINALRSAENQVLIFSGNLSWVNAVQGKTKIISIFEELAENNVSIKILCKVDLESINNIKKMLEINYKLKKELIEIKHAEQPFRAFIVDNKFARFKEKRFGREKNIFIFYNIIDEEWIEWIQKVFWNIFRTSISAEKRIKDIETIEKITTVNKQSSS